MQSENKRDRNLKIWLWIAAFFAFSFFPALMPEPKSVAWLANAGVILFCIPAYLGLKRARGNIYALRVFFLLGLFAITIETIGILTGLPYGRFVYGSSFGYKLFGLTPWTVFFAWTPICLASYALARVILDTRLNAKQFKLIIQAAAASLFTVVFDVVLDPAAVEKGYWTFASPGFWYNVPLSNYLGWFVSGFIGFWLSHLLLKNITRFKEIIWGGILIAVFWSGVCAWLGLTGPALIGLGFVVFLLLNYFKHDVAQKL